MVEGVQKCTVLPSTFFIKNNLTIMKTIIFDIDGTLTNMWPIEKSVLLYMTSPKLEKDIEKIKLSGTSDTYKIFLKISQVKISKSEYTNLYNKSLSYLSKNGKLPLPEKYPLVDWIEINKNKYNFVYATGGQKNETRYVLEKLGIIKYFNLKNSIDKTSYRFSKKTGIPFAKIKSKFEDCFLISDSVTDCSGAELKNIPYALVKSRQKLRPVFER